MDNQVDHHVPSHMQGSGYALDSAGAADVHRKTSHYLDEGHPSPSYGSGTSAGNHDSKLTAENNHQAQYLGESTIRSAITGHWQEWDYYITGSPYPKANKTTAANLITPGYVKGYDPQLVWDSTAASVSYQPGSFSPQANAYQQPQRQYSPTAHDSGPYYEGANGALTHDQDHPYRTSGVDYNAADHDPGHQPKISGSSFLGANAYQQAQSLLYPILNNYGPYDPSADRMATNEQGYDHWSNDKNIMSSLPGEAMNTNRSGYMNLFPPTSGTGNTSHQANAAPASTWAPPHATETAPNITTHDDHTAEPARPTCPECNKTFKRVADLVRHSGKHDPARRTYRCPVAHCDYKPSYRKDKLSNHMKNRHPGFSGS